MIQVFSIPSSLALSSLGQMIKNLNEAHYRSKGTREQDFILFLQNCRYFIGEAPIAHVKIVIEKLLHSC